MSQDSFSLRQRLRRWYQPFTAPSAALKNAQDQYRARILATLTLSGMIYIPLYILIRIISGTPENLYDVTVSAIIFAVMGMAYIFSRTRRYRLGVFIIIVPLSIVIMVQGIIGSPLNAMSIPMALIWIIPIVFFSSIILSLRLTALVIAGEVLLGLLVFAVTPNIPMAEIQFPLDYTFVFYLLIVLSGYLMGRYTRQIESQARDLASSEERYRSLFESSFVGIVVHENGTVVEANAGSLKSLGYMASEVIGKPIHQFFLPEKASDTESILDTTRFEMLARRRDGSKFNVEIYRKNVTYFDRPAQVLAFHDITEHRQSEENRVKLLAERERSQVLRQFISDVSHDVRTPLATINTSLYLLRRAMPEEDKPARYMDTIQAQAFHLNEVLESLLLMARLDDPDSYFEMTLLDLNQTVQEVVDANQSAALKKHHTLSFHSDAEVPLVRGDVDEIKRAIILLLGNALQYTPDGGEITIRTKQADDEVVIEVEDNGSGISPEDLPHIFQRFYRGDKARGQTQPGGAGMGLPIARKIIETLNGHIEVETEIGVGSTFRIFLPIVLQYAPQI